jgi:predicted aconitase with swiveling domain
MIRTFRGRTLVGGDAEGLALLSAKAFTFAHGVDPSTGNVTDVHSDIKGENVRGRILFYPYGKGSTTASSWFLETGRLGNLPAAIITESADLSVVIGSIFSRILYGKSVPVLSSFPKEMYQSIGGGTRVSVTGSSCELVVH